MWKLKLPDSANAMSELDTALTYANGTPKYALTPKEKAEITEIYKAYETAKGVSVPRLLGSTIKKVSHEAIEEGYKEVQIAGRLSALRDRLLVNAKRCPCCGILPADELDHHLPKVTYKILSVYSSNLVALCHKCNNKKRALAGLNPSESFIHVYYEDVPTKVQFLFAKTSLVGGALIVSFEIKQITEITKLVFEQLTFQLKRVNFHNRVNDEINIYLTSFAPGLQISFEAGGEQAAKKLLESTALHFTKTFGLNHWRTALMISLANFREFYNGGFYTATGLL